MRHFVACIFLLLLQFGVFAQNNCVPVFARNGKDAVYQAGERLDFTIHYTFGIISSDIGKASVTLDTAHVGSVKSFHCQVLGSTEHFYDRFFPVREDFNSWFSFDDLRPLRFTRNTQEGNYRATNEYTYRWDAAEPCIDATVFTTSLGQTKTLDIPLKECVFDLPSLFFFARNIDMSKVKKDAKYPMSFAIDDEIYDVYFIYRGRTSRRVKGLGKIKCLRFAAKLLEGEVFKGDNDMEIYISDDRNRLPVYFEAPLLVGNVQGRMSAFNGLKYPFSAKVN